MQQARKLSHEQQCYSKSPAFNVIVPVYNAEATLHRCLDSILSSSYTPLYVICVNDGSSDRSADIFLEKNKIEGRITRFISEPDHGIYDAINKGNVLADGNVCVFVNTDDIINADAVESCMAPILSGKADYAVSSVKVLTEAGDFICIKKPDFSKTWIAAPYCHQGMYCRTELLRKEGGFCLDYKIAADCALMWNLYRKRYRFSIIDAIFGGIIRRINNSAQYVVNSFERVPIQTGYPEMLRLW